MRILLCFFLAACGSTSSGDAGTDSGSDGMTTGDSSMTTDGSMTSDASVKDATGDVAQGQMCDISNDNCGPGLKCCTEPTHMQPPTHDICVPPEMNGTCPKYP